MQELTRRQVHQVASVFQRERHSQFSIGDQALLTYRSRGKKAIMMVTITRVERSTWVGGCRKDNPSSSTVVYTVRSASGGELRVSQTCLRPGNALDHISAVLEDD